MQDVARVADGVAGDGERLEGAAPGDIDKPDDIGPAEDLNTRGRGRLPRMYSGKNIRAKLFAGNADDITAEKARTTCQIDLH